MRRAIFLDRDGTLNRAVVRNGRPFAPSSADELEIFDGVAGALERLKAHGYLLIVATNQPDVARGTVTRAEVEAINRKLAERLPIDEFNVCYHDDADNCPCRKPKPGLLVDAASRHQIDLGASYMIGDRWRDVEAGRRAGCRTAFIDWGYDEPKPEVCDIRAASLVEAVNLILAHGAAPPVTKDPS